MTRESTRQEDVLKMAAQSINNPYKAARRFRRHGVCMLLAALVLSVMLVAPPYARG
ncbi:MAG: hypothetical protein QOJ85_4164, partial [Solirubrobacteraceae bacterium]|nr:hypothetical protein [Solirubrobacteraceae bacterium]